MRDIKRSRSATVIVCVLMIMISCGQPEKKNEQDTPQQQSEIKDYAVSGEKEYIEVDMASLAELKQGDTFEIKKTEEERYTLNVRRVQETMPGLISISANIVDRETGLATLILRENALSGILELYKENTRYQVGYDTTASRHYIQEVKVEDIDVLEESKPPAPPVDKN